MIEFFTTHYWMTFWLIVLLIFAITHTIDNILTVKNNRIKLETMKEQLRVRQNERYERAIQ